MVGNGWFVMVGMVSNGVGMVSNRLKKQQEQGTLYQLIRFIWPNWVIIEANNNQLIL